ncbi:MAG: autotransporter outer membrane beta-barrel domain-containing protein [Gammaproteobacteria bacterium]
MIRVRYGAVLGVALASISSPGWAVSAGCANVNAGDGDATVAANGTFNGSVNGPFDNGDVLLITTAGPPQVATVDLLPSNTALFSSNTSGTQSKTINEDGVSALGTTLLATAGAGASMTMTCTAAASEPEPVSEPTDDPDTGSDTQSDSDSDAGAPSDPDTTDTSTDKETGDDSSTVSTAQKVSALEGAATVVSANRLPTTAAALPGVASGASVFEREVQVAKGALRGAVGSLESASGYAEFQSLYEAYLEERRDLEVALSPGALFDGDAQINYEIIIGGGQGDPGKAGSREAREFLERSAALTERFEKMLEERGMTGLLERQRRVESLENDLEGAENDLERVNEDPAELGDGDIVLFTPLARGVGFALSTDRLLRAARAAGTPVNLDESALRIAGMPINLWVRGRATVFDAQTDAGYDGWALHALGGLAIKPADDVTLGAFVSRADSDTDSVAMGTDVEARQNGGGLYARYRVLDRLSAGLSLSRERGDQDIVIAGAGGSAQTTLTSASVSLGGQFVKRGVVVTPSVAAAWSRSERESYTDSGGGFVPESHSSDRTVSAAVSASRRYRLDGTLFRSLRPRLSATLNYFDRERTQLRVSTTEIVDLERWGGNLGAGVTLMTRGGNRVSMDFGVLGLGQNTLGYTGQIQLSVSF